MTLMEFKEALINTGLFKRKYAGQYVCKECPFCGDTKYHMYVKIEMDDNTPVLYNCFKCNSNGIMKNNFLEYFGLNLKTPRGVSYRKHINVSNTAVSSELLNEELFDYNGHEGYINRCRDYIYSRIGIIPTDEDMKIFGIINDPLYYYRNILDGKDNISNTRGWFRCTNGALIGRRLDELKEERWIKRKGGINNNSKALYSMRQSFDTGKPITVYIAEGIFDCIGLYYHYPTDNGIYIACLGRDYTSGIKYVMNRGIYGDSVTIKIFKDNDVPYVSLNKNICELFKEVHVYHNIRFKDYGTTRQYIEIERCQ